MRDDGDGQFDEADRRGDVVDEATIGSDKLDYWLVSIQRYYADYGGDALITSYCDHKPLRAAATVH